MKREKIWLGSLQSSGTGLSRSIAGSGRTAEDWESTSSLVPVLKSSGKKGESYKGDRKARSTANYYQLAPIPHGANHEFSWYSRRHDSQIGGGDGAWADAWDIEGRCQTCR